MSKDIRTAYLQDSAPSMKVFVHEKLMSHYAGIALQIDPANINRLVGKEKKQTSNHNGSLEKRNTSANSWVLNS